MENIIAGILAVTGIVEIYVLIYLVASPRQMRRKRFVRNLERLNIFLALFFVMTLGAFFLLNGQAYAENLTFDVKAAITGNGGDEIPSGPILSFPSGAPLNGTTTVTAMVLPAGAPMELVIPKIGVRVPIVFPTDTSTKGVLKSLESGVGVYPGSARPGQNGRMIVLGHSSRASWYHGDYARVFALLNRLVAGDEFMIVSGSMKYVYRVSSNQVLKPAATDAYLAQPVQGSVINLITCAPVGSAANRTIVSAELIAAGQ